MRIFALGVTILLLAGCGQKGPLYTPEPPQTPAAGGPASPAPTPAEMKK